MDNEFERLEAILAADQVEVAVASFLVLVLVPVLVLVLVLVPVPVPVSSGSLVLGEAAEVLQTSSASVAAVLVVLPSVALHNHDSFL